MIINFFMSKREVIFEQAKKIYSLLTVGQLIQVQHLDQVNLKNVYLFFFKIMQQFYQE